MRVRVNGVHECTRHTRSHPVILSFVHWLRVLSQARRSPRPARVLPFASVLTFKLHVGWQTTRLTPPPSLPLGPARDSGPLSGGVGGRAGEPQVELQVASRVVVLFHLPVAFQSRFTRVLLLACYFGLISWALCFHCPCKCRIDPGFASVFCCWYAAFVRFMELDHLPHRFRLCLGHLQIVHPSSWVLIKGQLPCRGDLTNRG